MESSFIFSFPFLSICIFDFYPHYYNKYLNKAKKVYEELKTKGIDVLLDDVEENISNKFKKHDLLGIPFQIIIGSKATKDQFEFKEIDKDSQMLDLSKIIKLLKN